VKQFTQLWKNEISYTRAASPGQRGIFINPNRPARVTALSLIPVHRYGMELRACHEDKPTGELEKGCTIAAQGC
jgi:hypothetical protein